MTKEEEEEGNLAGIGHLDSAVHSTGVSISATSVGGGREGRISFLFLNLRKKRREISRVCF